MKIKFVVLGKTHIPFVKEGEQIFKSRIKKYIPFQYEVLEVKKNHSTDTKLVKKLEAAAVLKITQPGDFVVLLDEKGKSMSSRKFSEWIQHKLNLSYKNIVFVVGGAFGFDDDLKKRADAKLSLSEMTYSHQMIRIIFLEQLYRAFTILRNEKYHND